MCLCFLALFVFLFVLLHSGLFLYIIIIILDAYLFSNETQKGYDWGSGEELKKGKIIIRIYCRKSTSIKKI